MKNWIEGKSVAVVGNAKSLFYLEYGQEIDSHDIVIRINRGLELCTNTIMQNTHGRKIDLWCFNLYSTLTQFDKITSAKIKQNYKKMQMNHTLIGDKFECIPKEDIDEISSIFTPKKASTGFRVLYHISKCNPKLVDVYGFDWKETKTYYMANKYNNVDLNHDYEKEKEYCDLNFFSTKVFNLKK